jgi:N-acetylglucosaminyl-diphospho-decaprenol L-rhamnosyltransferase
VNPESSTAQVLASDELSRCGAVIVADSRMELACRCASSLRAWLPPERIVIVLNRRDTLAVSDSALVGETAVISPAAPQGYGANVNLGVAHLDPAVEFAILANDDVVFEEESLPRLLEVLRRQPAVDLVGARLVAADGSDATSFASFPTTVDAILGAAVLPRPLWAARQRRLVARGSPRPDFVVGAAMVVRLSGFRAVGGFDESFFLNWEDADLSYRLRCAGRATAWCGDATVTHLQGASISRELNFASFYSGLRLFFRKRLGPVRWPLFEALLVCVFAGSICYSALAALLRPGSARLRLELLRQCWRTRIFLRRSTVPAGSR